MDKYSTPKPKKPRPVQLDEVVVTAKKVNDPGKEKRVDTVTHRLSPKGVIGVKQSSALRALKDKRVDAALSRNLAKPGEKPLLGVHDSDYIKKKLNNKQQ